MNDMSRLNDSREADSAPSDPSTCQSVPTKVDRGVRRSAQVFEDNVEQREIPGALRINLVGGVWGHGGIQRYCHELVNQLAGRVVYLPCETTASGLRHVPLLRQLPLGIRGLDSSAPVHIVKIVGAGVTLFRRLPPTVVTVHDLGFLLWPPERKMFTPAARFILYLSFAGLRRADRLIAISSGTERSLVQRLGIPPERIVRVHQGVDHDTFRPRPDARRELETRLGISGWDDWKTLITVGTELPRKRLPTVLRVVERYKRQGHRVRLLKVGRAGGATFRAATLRAITRADIADRVQLIADVDDEDLALLYSAADAFISASILADQDAPTLEAMACGTPVVIAGDTLTPDVAGEGGITIPYTGAPEAWIEALDAIFTQSAFRDRLASLGVRRAEQFSWKQTAEQTRNVYAALQRGLRP